MQIEEATSSVNEASSGNDSQSSSLSLPVEDYIFRGTELDDYSIYKLACVTCVKRTTATEKARYIDLSQRGEQNENSTSWNRRVLFQSEHSKSKSRWISFLRHSKVPCIVGNTPSSLCLMLIYQGPNIPHSDSLNNAEKRALYLLLLFKL